MLVIVIGRDDFYELFEKIAEISNVLIEDESYFRYIGDDEEDDSLKITKIALDLNSNDKYLNYLITSLAFVKWSFKPNDFFCLQTVQRRCSKEGLFLIYAEGEKSEDFLNNFNK